MVQLNQIEQDLHHGRNNPDNLQSLAEMIKQPDPSYWNPCLKIIQTTKINANTIRTYRAVLILTKLLTVNNFDNTTADMTIVIKQLTEFIKNLSNLDSDWNESIILQFCEILANLSHYKVENIDILLETFNQIGNLSILPRNPIVVFLSKLISKSEAEGIDNNPYATGVNSTYQALFQLTSLLEMLFSYYDSIDFFDNELNDYDVMLIECLQSIIADESFGKWILSYSNDLEWLKLCQLLIPEKKNWNPSQLLCLLSWSNDLFQLNYPKVIDSIDSESEESMKLAIVLDIFSELCQFDVSRNGFISYDIITPIIHLFGKIHQSVEPSNVIKPTKGSKYSHPHVKSTIVEIISYLVHDNKEMQDKIRELHGLELILSNCIIDDNNPFIKERAITCLKFLLANNQANQQIVRDLEAQGPQDNKILGITNEIIE